MNVRNLFLGVTVGLLFVLFITHTLYTNKMRINQILIEQSNPRGHQAQPHHDVRGTSLDVLRQIRNATSPVTKNGTHVSSGKCPLPFNCEHGANPAYEPVTKNISFMDVRLLYPEVKPGGSWSPDDCDPGQKVAIIIPYRDREEHLKLFLANIIPFLKMQKKAFTIFVIEQAGDVLFNRASLMNIGFIEALKMDAYTCFIFSDVDMIPIRLCNLYQCIDNEALHLGVSRNKDKPRIVYKDYVGGVLALDKKAMSKINGFSNIMFGWGGEDDEIFMRLKKEQIKVSHRPPTVGNYMMPAHKRDGSNPSSSRSFKQVYDNANYRKADGLSTVSYTHQEHIIEPLYTKIVVDITGPKRKDQLKNYYQTELQKVKTSFSESYGNADLRQVDGLSSVSYNVIKTRPDALFTRITVDFSGPKTKAEARNYFRSKVELHKSKLSAV